MKHICLGIAAVTGLFLVLYAPDASAGSKVSISKQQCQTLAKHKPVAGADYQAGVDSRGKKLKGEGAEIGGGSIIKIPDEISFDYSIDLADKYGLGTSASADATMGKVTIKNGKAYWNGQPMDGGDQASLADACNNTYGK